jgi:hypothetical protein
MVRRRWAAALPRRQVEADAGRGQKGQLVVVDAASLRDFADKPLVVLTAGEHPASWMAAQNRMLTLSTNSAQQIVAGATHTDVVLEEKYAAATAQAILAVVDSVRNDRPLGR